MTDTLDESRAGQAGARVERILAPAYRRLTIGIVSVILLVAFEAMAVATAMPVAVRELDGLGWYAWAFSAFLAASLFGMVVSGETCDRGGPRGPFLIGVVTFTVGLLIAGTATTMAVFVLARAVQGFGAGMNIVAIYVVVARAYPDRLRPRVFSAISSAWVLPSIVGPAVAGALADHWTWRAVFLAVPPLVVPALLITLPRLSELSTATPTATRRRGRKRLALAAAAGAVVLQYAGQRLGWTSLLLLGVAAALLVPSVPRLLPAGTLRARRGLPVAVALRGLFAGAFFGAEAFVPLMLVQQRGLATTLAGLSLTGGALGWAFGSWWQGRPGLRTSRPQLVRVGSLVVAAGIALTTLTVLDAVTPLVAALAWAVAGAGMGMAMASVSVLVLELSPASDQGANSAALQLADGFGSIVFIGLAGAIFTTFHSGPGASAGAFAGIFLTMAMVTLVAAMLAPRISVRAGRDTP